MVTLLNQLYCKLRREEIEIASTILMRIKIDTILQNLSRVCWKNNVEYELISKTNNSVSLLLIGYCETVVFKYHKTNMVSKEELDYFMNLVDEKRAQKGIYITTGNFEALRKLSFNKIAFKKDIVLQNGFTFIRGQLGIKGTSENLRSNKINFFKYLPL